MLKGKNIVIGITGGIAVYKICTLVSQLKKAGANIDVVMTKNATEFVSPITFETLSGNRVVVDTFKRECTWEVEHISLAKKADICVVAPCTANFTAKLAIGLADDFLSTTILACKCPILIAPAMNTNMLNNIAYKKNEEVLMARGFHFVSSGSGMLACGDVGQGRLAEPEVIYKEVTSIIMPKQDYVGKNVLITLGGTIEYIDPVRFVGNFSSGKMGYALALAALNRGANVTVIKARTSIAIADARLNVVEVVTTRDMYDAVMSNMETADIIIKAAAPCDFRPSNNFDNKIKQKSITIDFEATEDIAQAVGKVKGNRKLVIFAAETNDVSKNAREKLVRKNADMVVANDVTAEGAGFMTDTNIAKIITKNGEKTLKLMQKSTLSDIILDNLAMDM